VRVGHDGGEVSYEIADAGAGRGAHEVGGKRAQQREAGALLGCVVGGEQRPPAHAESLDEARDEHIGRHAVELGGGAAVQRDEALDAFARLGGHLRGLGGGGEADDEVDLACLSSGTEGAPGGAPAGDLDDARELDLAQLDGRPRQRAHDGSGVLWVDEQSQPGEHVAHLGALQKADRLNRVPLLAARCGVRPTRRAVGRRGRDP